MLINRLTNCVGACHGQPPADGVGGAGPGRSQHQPLQQGNAGSPGGFPFEAGWIGQAWVATKALVTTKIDKGVAKSRCPDRLAQMVLV